MTKGITWEEADGMFEALTKAVKEQGLHDYQVTKTETGWQAKNVDNLQKVMVCDKCNYQFLLTELQIETAKNLCPMCGNGDTIFPLWIDKELASVA